MIKPFSEEPFSFSREKALIEFNNPIHRDLQGIFRLNRGWILSLTNTTKARILIGILKPRFPVILLLRNNPVKPDTKALHSLQRLVPDRIPQSLAPVFGTNN